MAGRKPQVVRATGGGIEVTSLAVCATAVVFTPHEQSMVELGGRLADLDKAIALGAGTLEGAFLLELDAPRDPLDIEWTRENSGSHAS